jgi:hypothetical protein
VAEVTAAALRKWASEKQQTGHGAEARELERLAAVNHRIEVLPRGSTVPCDCPRAVDCRPRRGDESITVWHRPECEATDLQEPPP